nr:hypothetical protein Iba_chr04dCG2480 [Ipomoea batatas]
MSFLLLSTEVRPISLHSPFRVKSMFSMLFLPKRFRQCCCCSVDMKCLQAFPLQQWLPKVIGAWESTQEDLVSLKE